MPDAQHELLADAFTPSRWPLMQVVSDEEYCQAWLRLLWSAEGQAVVTRLIVGTLLTDPQTDRDVGKQDLVREILLAIQQGALMRQRGEYGNQRTGHDTTG